MPLYDWHCVECDTTAECVVSWALVAQVVVACPQCGRQLQRQITAARGGDVSDWARERLPSYGRYDESLDQTFHSVREREGYLRDHDLVEVPEGVHGLPKEKRRLYVH